MIAVIAVAQVNVCWVELLISYIIEIIVWREKHTLVIAGTKVMHSNRCRVAVILASHMVGHKVQHELQPDMVNASDEILKLSHAVGYVYRKFRAYVIIVTYGVGRAGLPLHHMRVAWLDTVLAEITACGMLDNACWPHMCRAKVSQFGQQSLINVIEFTATVLLKRAACDAVGIVVGEPTRKKLIDDRFHSSC